MAQVVGQIKQRRLMSQVGPHALVPPTSYGEGVGSETGGDLPPRQAGLHLEPLQALSRLARKGELIRVCQGVYVRPIQTRFGPRTPSIDKVLASLSALWGETIVPCGGMAANALGLTTQVPVRQVHLTSGPNRKLKLGGLVVELRHAPRWQLVAPHRPAGDAVRALAWLGPEEGRGESGSN